MDGFETVPEDSTFAIAIKKPGAGCAQQCSINCNSVDLAAPYCWIDRCRAECDYQNGLCSYKD